MVTRSVSEVEAATTPFSLTRFEVALECHPPSGRVGEFACELDGEGLRILLVQFVNNRLPSPTCAIINDGQFDPPSGPSGRVTFFSWIESLNLTKSPQREGGFQWRFKS